MKMYLLLQYQLYNPWNIDKEPKPSVLLLSVRQWHGLGTPRQDPSPAGLGNTHASMN